MCCGGRGNSLDARGCWQHPFIACMTCHTLCYVFDRDFVYQIKRKLNTRMQARAVQFACSLFIQSFRFSSKKRGTYVGARAPHAQFCRKATRWRLEGTHAHSSSTCTGTVTTRARQLRPGNLDDDIRPLQIIEIIESHSQLHTKPGQPAASGR